VYVCMCAWGGGQKEGTSDTQKNCVRAMESKRPEGEKGGREKDKTLNVPATTTGSTATTAVRAVGHACLLCLCVSVWCGGDGEE
jgi:hypothetical protein